MKRSKYLDNYIIHCCSVHNGKFNIAGFKENWKYHVNLYIKTKIMNERPYYRDCLGHCYCLVKFAEAVGILYELDPVIFKFELHDDEEFIKLDPPVIIQLSEELLSKKKIKLLERNVSEMFKKYTNE